MSEDVNKRLSRWSQRKLAARRGVAVDAGDDKPDAAAENPQPAIADADSAADEATPVLPPIDELTAESDYTVFFGKNVSTALKNAALAKLWRSDPVFANRDGLCDYDEDFNALQELIAPEQTSYQVGKGYLDKIENAVAKLEPANDTGGRRLESQEAAVVATSDDETDNAALGKSDAVRDGENSAPRQADAIEPDTLRGGPMEDNGN